MRPPRVVRTGSRATSSATPEPRSNQCRRVPRQKSASSTADWKWRLRSTSLSVASAKLVADAPISHDYSAASCNPLPWPWKIRCSRLLPRRGPKQRNLQEASSRRTAEYQAPLAQWQSSGLLIRRLAVRARRGAPRFHSQNAHKRPAGKPHAVVHCTHAVPTSFQRAADAAGNTASSLAAASSSIGSSTC